MDLHYGFCLLQGDRMVMQTGPKGQAVTEFTFCCHSALVSPFINAARHRIDPIGDQWPTYCRALAADGNLGLVEVGDIHQDVFEPFVHP